MSNHERFFDLSPSPNRVGRVCAWIEQEGRVLMAGLAWGGWTLPGGRVQVAETPAEAAVREAWEQCGAVTALNGPPIMLRGLSGQEEMICYSLRLLSLEHSPNGRRVAWVNPRSLPWADDWQIREVLALLGKTPPHLALPVLVTHAQAQAALLGFKSSSSLETGRLLRSLAASRPAGRLLELGSGVGVGSAWLLSGMNHSARLLTVESDPARAHATWELLRHDARAEVLCGDWADPLGYGPFDLIFSDCGPARLEYSHLNRLVDALKLGGVLILDDFSPPARLPLELHGGDPQRDALFTHPRLTSVEMQVSQDERVILATRTL